MTIQHNIECIRTDSVSILHWSYETHTYKAYTYCTSLLLMSGSLRFLVCCSKLRERESEREKFTTKRTLCSRTSDNGHSEEWTTSLYNGQTVRPLPLYLHFYLQRKETHLARQGYCKSLWHPHSPQCYALANRLLLLARETSQWYPLILPLSHQTVR